jgi:hypothetical protein
MRITFISLIALAACTQAETIPDNVCGNGVLEPGEDCDAPGDPACTATCRIVCSVANRTTCTGAPDGTCCPGDSTCGVDGVCHTPSGQIAAEFAEPYDVTTELIADIDGDHIADALGVNNVEIAVRYGDPQTPLARELTEPSPVLTGGVSFGDMTGDGRPDVVIPTTAGMFAWENSTGEPEPIPFPARVDANATHLRIGTTPAAVITLDLETTNIIELGSGSRDFATTNASFKPCNTSASLATSIRGREIHPYVDGARTLVPIPIGSSVCVAELGGTTGQEMGSANTTALAGTRVDANGEAFLSSLGSGNCPSLIAPLTTSATKDQAIIVPGTGATGSCTIETTAAATAILPGSPFAAIQLATMNQPWALVTSSGIVDLGGNVLAPATRTWTYALVTDLDGDGIDDIVVADSGADIEVLYQRATTGTTPQLLDVVIPTIDTVEYLATGDFDGDGNGDVAFGTIDATMTGGPADLQIAWGAPSGGGFVETDVGNIVEPHDLVATNLVDVSLPNGYDQFDDLIVAKGGDTGDPALLVAEYGSSTRDLTAPFVFTSRFGGTAATQPIRATGTSAMIGNFGSGGGSGVYAVFGTTNTDVPSNFTAVALTETSFGDFTASDDVPFSSCGAPMVTDGSAADTDVPFCVTNSHFTRWERAAPLPDMVLASRSDVDGGALTQCMAYATATNLALTPISCADLATVDQSDPNADEELASLTDVATARLFVGSAATRYFLAKQATDAEYAVAWKLDANASDAPQLSAPIDFNGELTPVVAAETTGATAHCMDAIAVELGTRTVDGAVYGADVDELVLACVVGVVGTKVGSAGAPTTQLWARYEAADQTQPPSYTQLVDLGIDEVIHLRDGDVNGDGLTDILYSLGTAGAGKVELHTFLQCDTHTTGCMGGQ